MVIIEWLYLFFVEKCIVLFNLTLTLNNDGRYT